MGPPALGHCQQRVWGPRGRLAPLGLQVQEWLGNGGLCTLPRGGDRRRSTLTGRLRLPHQPALGHAIVISLKTLSAGCGIQRVPGVPGEGVGAHLGDGTKGVGNTGDTAEFLEGGALS
jgi:hypothetical protein